MTILFVYGTLKRGLRNHRLIADQVYLGEAATEPRYRVIDLGPYPGLIVDDFDGLAVRGELWAVSECCLAELDDFEEVPGPFIRETVAIKGRDEEVFAYFWNRPVPGGAKAGDRWRLTGEPGVTAPTRRSSCSGPRGGSRGTSRPAARRGRSCRGCGPCGRVRASRRAS